VAATVNVNGVISDEQHAVISVFDHGFLYGEGVYETLRTYGGRPFLFERHMARLRSSASGLRLELPLDDETMAARIDDTIDAAGFAPGSEAYVRVLLTRGVGPLSYDPAATPSPSIVVIVKPHVPLTTDIYQRGVEVAIVPIVRNHPGSISPLIKSNNLLNNALAMQEAVRRGAFEGVMRNYRGEIAECTSANLFIVDRGAALTPPLDAGLLPGITRGFLFEVGADVGVPVREQALKDADLLGADEAFLTATTKEIVPIVRVDGQAIGDGHPGPVTRALLDAYRARARSFSETAFLTGGGGPTPAAN
jgi:branched-chain amino acid aminotransferase